MFMNTEQKSLELLTIPNNNINHSPTKYMNENRLPSPNPFMENNTKSNSLPVTPLTTNHIHSQLDDSISKQNIKKKTAKDIPNVDTSSNHNTAKLVPEATSPRHLMNSPVPKLVPMTLSGSLEGGKPMIRARSHSVQRPTNDYEKGRLNSAPMIVSLSETDQLVPNCKSSSVNVPSPLARRARSATTLRPSEEENGSFKILVNSKQPKYLTQDESQRQNSNDSNIKTSNLKNIPSLKSVVSEAEIYKQKLEHENQQKMNIPVVQPLSLDTIHSQQQFYDSVWNALNDLQCWLDAMENGLLQLNHDNVL
ncbi:uncharacterized protein BX663DRAFT_236619 [Cokeromyces recurvatus]|uniref:uncharacterized protein n=1 Tax=Cokeromyces recurvatus TaxID=90255 RepID=UPI00221F2B6D|nr:uncharacterized protein BX663DRAFT_236619 [Cokeromyces recurvatus]KAI7898611.1 hypothetical protein BX663DRAFT_236619 [Cokeromyces recurvatus]